MPGGRRRRRLDRVWLAQRAGPGNVTATELFPQYLAGAAEQGVRVLRHDVTQDPPVGEDFDLIHARLVLEDVAFVPEIAVRPALRRIEEKWLELATGTVGSDLTWARTFPLPLERAGLTETAAEISSPVMRGGSPVAIAFQASVRVGVPAMLAASAITSEEVAEVYAMCADPEVVDWSYQMLVAWGRRSVGG
jgi:hypothetical protein